jgi:hypothetical protein
MPPSETSPNGKWRPSKRSHGQRPPTPSIRLQDESGCHNDSASAVPANRPMMSTISNTFADGNIDEEEKEGADDSHSTEEEDGGEGYVIQVKPLPKIRLDLCPAPREEDEYRRSRRKSSGGRKSSPRKSKDETRKGVAIAERTSGLDSSFTSIPVTDKASNGGGLDATKATVELLARTQNDEHPLLQRKESKKETTNKGEVVRHTFINADADGFPIFETLDDTEDRTGNEIKNQAPIESSLECEHAKEQHQKKRSQPSPDNIKDAKPVSPHQTLSKNKTSQTTGLPTKGKGLRMSPASTVEARQDGRRRQQTEGSAEKEEDDEKRSTSVEDWSCNNTGTSPIFDWLLMFCSDVSSFVSEGLGTSGAVSSGPKHNSSEQSQAKSPRHNESQMALKRDKKTERVYTLDNFRWE